MKKLALLLTSLAATVTLSSCVAINVQGELEHKEPQGHEITEKEDEPASMGGMQLVNPIKSYGSSEEITEVLGFTVRVLPEAEEIKFSTISNDVAQVNFTFEEINYTLRANDDEGDFSGVYITAESEYEIIHTFDQTSIPSTVKELSNGHKLIFWSNPDKSVHYSLYIEGASESIEEIVKAVIASNSTNIADQDETLKKTDHYWKDIRTDGMGYESETVFPYAVIINSKEELNEYYEANKDKFYLERVEKVYADTTIGFLNEADKYDDEKYFSEKTLILVVTENGSGSIRHSVEKVEVSDTKTVITLKNNTPEILTDDMANWHIFVSVPIGSIKSNNIEIVFE